jgi:hypothetical protein
MKNRKKDHIISSEKMRSDLESALARLARAITEQEM